MGFRAGRKETAGRELVRACPGTALIRTYPRIVRVSFGKLVILRLTVLQIMNLSVSWLYILFVSVGMGLINGAITGTFYTSGRGGNRPLFATVKSVPVRFILFSIGFGLLFWTIRDGIHRISGVSR
jgi:hypothetical protein